MPELPEVETTCRGIRPLITGQTLERLIIREPRLRWPVTGDWIGAMPGNRVNGVRRRGKYILIETHLGTLILHLGMSGSLRVSDPLNPPRKHDHIELLFTGGCCLRFHDPRRFGCLCWTDTDADQHPLLANLGPEPLEQAFGGGYLAMQSARRTTPIKSFIMDSRQVVGVGNIYANEALFRAGVLPHRRAGDLSSAAYDRLAQSIRQVLESAIAVGGTTLRDFVNAAGTPGYFSQTLNVYDRAGQPCRCCGQTIRLDRLGQRATYWCPACQA
ncbi:bifunctional DNA-formamidopyrimidine glycosylase/DNA-(apurinic or apyrimidinic site) lyase [Candidatus Woesearchaeota archaeon]|nr:bifunctional DNA-formamidopyrimidine glycosylase/DNA-(apurinic or apyrimidinic site) lyase [Candidatus Woesearchaeota archaeon]